MTKKILPKLTLILTGLLLGLAWLPTAVALAQDPDPVDVQLSPLTGRAPQLAQSSQYLALVYQQGSYIFLRSTRKDTDLTNNIGWISIPALVGSGTAPNLAFSDNDTVYIVWQSSNNRQVLYRACDLTDTQATCAQPASNINADDGSTVRSPDIVIKTNTAYVAWISAGVTNQVRVARTSLAGLLFWTIADDSDLTITNPLNSQLAIGASNSYFHLIYTYGENTASDSTRLRYARSADGSDWSGVYTFFRASNYEKVSNPAIATAGSHVYLAWDSQFETPNGDSQKPYALYGTLSNNEGASWLEATGTTLKPEYQTSRTKFDDIQQLSDRLVTRDVAGANPSEEAGLRPSLAVSPSNDFVLVWQQRPSTQPCEDDEDGTTTVNGASQIQYAAVADPDNFAGSWWASREAYPPSNNYYAIDPDLVVDAGGNANMVFMKSTAANGAGCRGGGDLSTSTEYTYAIYYKGPYTEIAPSNTYSISGRVTDVFGNPIEGVLVGRGGDIATTTNSNGEYVFNGLIPGTYILTPLKDGYEFLPSSIPVNLTSNTSRDFTGKLCQSPHTGINICQLQKGDILFSFGELYRISQHARMIAGTYWWHTAIWVSENDSFDGQFLAHAVGAQPPPEDEIRTESIYETYWWTGTNLKDWAVVRPLTTDLIKDQAADYARLKADQTLPPIVYNTDFINKDDTDKFYCSQLVWKGYERQGVNLETNKGWVSPGVTPDDLYYSVGVLVKASLVQQNGEEGPF
ncbi:MAG TPA: carboxypeptidase regulatory-like domain-containing protein, partial [Anaerolineae bacterium]|nr:carboxypeptidase regulatory-like domain-containing protein [Anaerolineae bacterium]